jgi:Flp pilus assembly protein TadD
MINYRYAIGILFTIVIINSCKNTKQKNGDNSIDKEYIKKIEPIADLAYEQEQYSNSVYIYSKLVSLDSTEGKYYFRRGFSYMMLQKLDSAIPDYQQAIKLGYKKSKAYQNIGAVYFGMLDNDSMAIYYFKRAVETDVDNIKARELLEVAENRYQKRKK